MKIALSVLYLLHESMKWVSSSIKFGQNLQNLSSLVTGGLLCPGPSRRGGGGVEGVKGPGPGPRGGP